jgi:predicted transposase YbfD/YdcC
MGLWGVEMSNSSFLAHFSVICDKRQQLKVRHKLLDVLFMIVAAIIAGQLDMVTIHYWVNCNADWFAKFLELPGGIPSIHTFRRILRLVDPVQLEKCFVQWVRQIAGGVEGACVSIDGKTNCGSRDGDHSAIHIVSAWLNKNGLTLGEVKTSEKSNEITAIPQLLALLNLKGCTVTIDAAGAQKKIVDTIVNDNGADYVIALKQNQSHMFWDTELFFTGRDRESEEAAAREAAKAAAALPGGQGQAAISVEPIWREPACRDCACQSLTTTEKGHGRIEKREYFLADDTSFLRDAHLWAGLKAVGMVRTTITNAKSGAKTSDERFFISSTADINQFADAARSHWGIESTHWALDVTWREDYSRICKENEPANMSLIRKMALNLHKKEKQLELKRMEAEPDLKLPYHSYKVRCLHASLDLDYLEKVMIKNII